MSVELQNEVRELRRRFDLAEMPLSQLEGRFEFISGQLRDVQLYMHARFEDIDCRFEQIDKRFDLLDAKVDALPRIIAELISKR